MIPQYVMIPHPVILGYTLSRALKVDAEFRFRFAYAWRARIKLKLSSVSGTLTAAETSLLTTHKHSKPTTSQ
jgi:hypothetical protein